MSNTQYRDGQSDNRPWGSWKVLSANNSYTVKHIEVLPDQRLSLQYHTHRSEHWVVIDGSGKVTIGGDQISVERGSHIYVSRETNHRIHNDGVEPLIFVELQIGSYLDENDIVRLEDDYSRD